MEVNSENNDNCTIQRIAGGSVIRHEPRFSLDGEIIFIIWDQIVRAYSTQTGEWIRDLEGANSEIINLQYDPENPKILIGCTIEGQLVFWKWKSGVVSESITLKLKRTSAILISGFNFVELDKRPCGLIIWSDNLFSPKNMNIFDLKTGEQIDLMFKLNLSSADIKLDYSNELKYFGIAQGAKLHVGIINKPKIQKLLHNANGKEITCIKCHPIEEMIITGDITGKIFLWRNLLSENQPITQLYHWHHTTVNSVYFTKYGNSFYSGGDESVLVRWNCQQQLNDQKEFLPRLAGTVKHIAVSGDNQKIALATNDNGIQILNTQFKVISVIQNFTWVPEDKTILDKFPIGLKVHPRTTSLVLNGRSGHLQFFSTHTRSLLFNMDITMQNSLSLETDKVLYNTCVTKVAFNMDWMVTVEVLDDQDHFIETRLKFWLFDVEKQNYILNTQIEVPHGEDPITAIEFSSSFGNDENLLCATSGEDNFVKLWSLEMINNINKKGKYWTCISKLSYKNLPIKSVAFSNDGSLLAVGYGNTLCIYSSDTQKIKCILSAPAGLDGSANKITIDLINNNANNKTKTSAEKRRNNLRDKRSKVLQLIKSYFENDDKKLIKELTNDLVKLNVTNDDIDDDDDVDDKQQKDSLQLTLDEQELIFKKIMSHNELQFSQKLEIFAELSLHVKVGGDDTAVNNYIEKYLSKNDDLLKNISTRIERLGSGGTRKKYELSKKLFQYFERKNKYQQSSESTLRSIFNKSSNGIDVGGGADDAKVTPRRTRRTTDTEKQQDKLTITNKSTEIKYPIKNVTQIKSIKFGTGEFGHLVIVCTENRLLIWNLLTLRLQTAIKLTIKRITIDPYTSLVAAFTGNNELYVFLPNVPYPLYQRKNMPPIFGAAWIPRRYPKSQSINLDWQATSQLYFLSDKQELLTLVADGDSEYMSPNTSYLGDSQQALPTTPFGAMIAKQIQNNTNKSGGGTSDSRKYLTAAAIGVIGKSCKEITSLQTHTMAPINLLCKGLLKSLVSSTKSTTTSTNNSEHLFGRGGNAAGHKVSYLGNNNNNNNNNESDEEEDEDITNEFDDGNVEKRIEARRVWLNQSIKVGTSFHDDTTINSQLRRTIKHRIQLKL